MEEVSYDKFQRTVSDCLIRHKSILDVTSKLQEACARVNRAVAKSVTCCGCVRVKAGRQNFPPELDSYSKLKAFMDTHLEGSLCDHCREVIESEMGQTQFYLAALCDLLGLDMEEVLSKEYSRVATLGTFNLL
ncbi:MAG: DUF1573 domain-containing protein [Firmicutes bacterium]|nr:DUF1573 domain-containing protein [Bacillota bacterium]